MEIFTENAHLSLWLIRYGSITLFFLLALGIIALPVPEETLLVLSGILINCEKLHALSTFFSSLGGSICGITVSYFLGRTAGFYLVTKYGNWIGITEKRLNKVHQWFEKFGKWTLFIGYFVPGVRHFTGLSAGIAKLEIKVFGLFAYSGALIWVSVFLSIGYFFGRYWLAFLQRIELNTKGIAMVLAIAILFAFFIYLYKKKNFK